MLIVDQNLYSVIMVKFTATIHQFAQQGEKTGWTYIEVPVDIAQQLKPGNKKSFRVKGKLDKHPIAGVALVPMGGGRFIMAFNAAMRKGTHKKKGAMLEVQLAVDNNLLEPTQDFIDCLADEPKAKAFFEKLKPSHRNYFIKWMAGVTSEIAVAKRMATVIDALSKGQDAVMMFQHLKAEREKNANR